MAFSGLPRKRPADDIEPIVKNYGDLLFDFCESVLWSPINAQLAFRSILKEIRKRRTSETFSDHERAWILKIACNKLRTFSRRHGRHLTPAERVESDAANSAAQRLKKFDSYFHRLGTDDQLLLLLKDKYGIPLSEIASAMAVPEASLKIRRQLALRTLEDWLWGAS